MDVSVPHEQPASAERGPKARTRKLMLETAIALMQRQTVAPAARDVQFARTIQFTP